MIPPKTKKKPRGRPWPKGFRAGPGRRKGQVSKVTGEVRELCQNIVRDENYLKNLTLRMIRGDVPPQVEQMVWVYAFGKPKESIEIEQNVTTVDVTPKVDPYQQLVSVIRALVEADVIPAEAFSKFAVNPADEVEPIDVSMNGNNGEEIH